MYKWIYGGIMGMVVHMCFVHVYNKIVYTYYLIITYVSMLSVNFYNYFVASDDPSKKQVFSFKIVIILITLPINTIRFV